MQGMRPEADHYTQSRLRTDRRRRASLRGEMHGFKSLFVDLVVVVMGESANQVVFGSTIYFSKKYSFIRSFRINAKNTKEDTSLKDRNKSAIFKAP